MTTAGVMRTIDLARAAQISVQQVRNYEASGLLPAATRSSAGYRLYTRQHLLALTTGRGLMAGYGRLRALTIMQAIHSQELSRALACIDERHAELAEKRLQLEQTLAALKILGAQSSSLVGTPYAPLLRVGEAARQVHMRVSALRFWEQVGLLEPGREQSSRYRLYDETQMLRLRVIVLLKDAGYDFPVIRSVLNELAAGQLDQAITHAEQRLGELTRTSWMCIEGLAAFQSYVKEFYPCYL